MYTASLMGSYQCLLQRLPCSLEPAQSLLPGSDLPSLRSHWCYQVILWLISTAGSFLLCCFPLVIQLYQAAWLSAEEGHSSSLGSILAIPELLATWYHPLATPHPCKQENLGSPRTDRKPGASPVFSQSSLKQMRFWKTVESDRSPALDKKPFGQSMIIQLHSGHSLLILWIHIYLLGPEISIVFVFMCNVWHMM